MLWGKWESKFKVNIFLCSQVRKKFLESIENEIFILNSNCFWNIGCYCLTLGRWNFQQTLKHTEKVLYTFALFHISLSSWGWERRQKFCPVESLSANTKWPETGKLLFNMSTTYFMEDMEDMERASFQKFIRTCIWCLEGFFQQSCADQREKILPSCSFSWWNWDLIQSIICIVPSKYFFVFFDPANVRK